MSQATFSIRGRGIFFTSLASLVLISCSSSDIDLSQENPTPIANSTEESAMPDTSESELEAAADNDLEESDDASTISSQVFIPDYEPLDLPISQWEAHRSQELLEANGFGNTAAEWRRAAGHPSGLIRGAAFYLLSQQPDPQDEDLFRQGLDDIDETARALAAFGLVQLGDETAIATLEEIARLDVNAHLAAPRAAGLLAEMGRPEGVDTLERALSSREGYIRLTAAQFLPQFVPLQGQSDGAGNTVDVWEIYCQALADSDPQIRTLGEMQLREIGSAEALAVIEDCSGGG
jgi:hypothetical protein